MDFKLLQNFGGYVRKLDKTNIREDKLFLVYPSQNVLINDGEKVATRGGYELLGAVNAATTPIESSFDWLTSSGREILLRGYDDELEIYVGTIDSIAFNAWHRLKASWSAVDFSFTTWWDTAVNFDILLFVVGDDNIYDWTGGMTTLKSVSEATIVEAGDVANQLSSWVLTGATTLNTNSFVLYWKLEDVAGTRTVSIYKDSGGAAGDLVAQGSLAGDGSITLTEENSSGLSGSVTVAFTADDTTLAANTLTLSYSITKNGTTTWAQERFSATGSVIINGTEYTYTGGTTTDTLTGVTASPAAEAANSLIYQSVRTNADEPASGAVNDIIGTLNNHIFLGSLTQREVSVSNDDDYKDFSFSSPRVPGEGELLVLDNPLVGLISQQQEMWITAGKDDWYNTKFEQLDIGGILSETLNVKKLMTAPQQGAYSGDFVCKAKTGIVFVSNEPSLDALSQVEDPTAISVSDPIKEDFDGADFSNGHCIYFKGKIYIAEPANSKVYIYDVVKKYWQPPQVLPIRRFAIYNGDLYGHSNSNPETYKLFTGTNDNAKSFSAKAVFAYRSYGSRDALKNMDEWFTEGYIRSNTELILQLNFDFGGYTQALEKIIKGNDDTILFEDSGSGSLGDNPLGDNPLGDTYDEANPLSKFKIFYSFVRQDFFELQAIYATDETDAQWELLACGGNVDLSKNKPIHLKQ